MHRGGRWIAPGLTAVVGALIAIAAVVVSGAGASPRTPTDTPPSAKTVMVVGDSVALIFSDDFARAAAKHGYDLVTAAHGGCPATGVAKVSSSGVKWKHHTCAKVAAEQDAMVERYRPALVIWWSRYELAPRVGPDGKLLPLGSDAWLRAQEASFDARTAALTKYGARLVTVQIEPPGPELAVRNPVEKYFLVGRTLLRRTNVVKSWNEFLASHTGPTVFSISVADLVCHKPTTPCNDTLPDGESARPDGVHYSQAAQRLLAPTIFDDAWRAAQMQSASK